MRIVSGTIRAISEPRSSLETTASIHMVMLCSVGSLRTTGVHALVLRARKLVCLRAFVRAPGRLWFREGSVRAGAVPERRLVRPLLGSKRQTRQRFARERDDREHDARGEHESC